MPNPGKKILSDLYDVQKKKLRQIGKIYGVSRERVRQWMEGFYLPRRKTGGDYILNKVKLELCEKYIKGESVIELAKKYRVSVDTIYYFFREQVPGIRLKKKEFREKMRDK